MGGANTYEGSEWYKHRTCQTRLLVYLDFRCTQKQQASSSASNVLNSSHLKYWTNENQNIFDDWGPEGLMDVFPICPNNFGHIGLCNVIDSLLRELLVLYGGAVSNHSTPKTPCLVPVYGLSGLVLPPFSIGLMNLVVRWQGILVMSHSKAWQLRKPQTCIFLTSLDKRPLEFTSESRMKLWKLRERYDSRWFQQ